MNWLDAAFSEGRAGLLSAADRKALAKVTGKAGGAKGRLKTLLSNQEWVNDENMAAALKPVLLRLVARYLVVEKRGGASAGDRALDPVAHFHLSNGAVMERLNWLGDTSGNGFDQSAGIMINYLYDLATIDDNHEAYADGGKITASSDIRGLL